jgi:mRNA interferase RelE/StbE
MPQNGYLLLYKKSVDKDLRRLPTAIRKRLVEKIGELSNNPHPGGSTKLRGSTDLYRVRYTDYRIIYQIRGSELIILIIKVGHRKEVYRDL